MGMGVANYIRRSEKGRGLVEHGLESLAVYIFIADQNWDSGNPLELLERIYEFILQATCNSLA